MEETVEQKIIRNIQGNFAVYKTPEVLGDKTFMPNIEWQNPDDIDKFFMFAKNLGSKVIYLAEGDEEDESTGQTTNTILQVGFIHQGIMHHINFVEDDDEDDDDDEEDEEEYEDEEDEVQQELPSTPTQPKQPSNAQQDGFVQQRQF